MLRRNVENNSLDDTALQPKLQMWFASSDIVMNVMYKGGPKCDAQGGPKKSVNQQHIFD